jgi:hypothetical protein
MTVQKRTYERIINRKTDQLMKKTIGQVKEYKKVLFFPNLHFLFLIPDAHLAHCLLHATAQARPMGKSQRAKLTTFFENKTISKVIFFTS